MFGSQDPYSAWPKYGEYVHGDNTIANNFHATASVQLLWSSVKSTNPNPVSSLKRSDGSVPDPNCVALEADCSHPLNGLNSEERRV
jgi:hypothetical protein